jgi:hypothetical protein
MKGVRRGEDWKRSGRGIVICSPNFILQDLIPRINVLLQIFQGTRSIIFGEPED